MIFVFWMLGIFQALSGLWMWWRGLPVPFCMFAWPLLAAFMFHMWRNKMKDKMVRAADLDIDFANLNVWQCANEQEREAFRRCYHGHCYGWATAIIAFQFFLKGYREEK